MSSTRHIILLASLILLSLRLKNIGLNILFAEQQACPRIAQLDKEVRDSDYMQEEVYNANKDLFEYISECSGENITSVEELSAIYDALLVETNYNKTLPDWTKSVFPGGKFDQLRKLSFTHDTYSDELKKLKAGPFISEVITHYKDFISPVKNTDILMKIIFFDYDDRDA